MNENGVTIVIPNWNHEAFLSRSIGSALQAVRQLEGKGLGGEVVVIDDHSRDGSLSLLRRLEARYYQEGLRVASRAENRGLAAARNLGLSIATYRYLVLMDADNELVPENLGLFHRSIVNTRAAVVFGNLLRRDLNAMAACGVLSYRSFHPSIFDGNYIDAFAMVDRAQVLDAGGYDSSCTAHEDYELWLHLASTGHRLVFVPSVLGYYYQLKNSMITREDPEKFAKVHQRVKRIFNQVGARASLPLTTNCLRYHPDLGFL